MAYMHKYSYSTATRQITDNAFYHIILRQNQGLNVILLSFTFHIILLTGILTLMLYFYLYHVQYTPDRNLDLNVDIYHAKN